MNILIINGSPRKKGLISQMLGMMQQEAGQRGGTAMHPQLSGKDKQKCLKAIKRL